MDLARGHNDAIQKLVNSSASEVLTINLGTGRGYSVLEVLSTFEKICGRKIPFDIVDRREGDVACCYAAPGLAKQLINWEAEFGIYEMCEHAWKWQKQLDRLGKIEKE